ncbi:hypothetical protein [Candidatus Parabeggiatoa sp. HSG14]|uniref:hypothetical protein n=1 Tax=Candidatus Parabeggiatoa sp. HSG14 TaxID=3055593 RepID=UPI0025A69E4E|nr:hypothetical protein [Thiotrichales bacterium HSG14]
MRIKNIVINSLLLVLSILTALFIAEGFLRFYYQPYAAHGVAVELNWMRNNPHDLTKIFTVDPNFGFRPLLGNDLFNEYGTLHNGYSVTKKSNITRLLFIGDSVTYRGRIINALKRIYGEQAFEYWNAGVESFNTIQEVNFYKKYNAAINADHVILTFHLNDFETTPIAFYEENRLVVYAPNIPINRVNPWLFKNSHLYRFLLGVLIGEKNQHKEVIAQEIQQSLTELRDILKSKDILFTVLVLPFLKPFETWTPQDKESREKIISILSTSNIRYFDLLETLNDAVKKEVNIQELQGDAWHPSDDVSHLFANYLREKQLLQ